MPLLNTSRIASAFALAAKVHENQKRRGHFNFLHLAPDGRCLAGARLGRLGRAVHRDAPS